MVPVMRRVPSSARVTSQSGRWIRCSNVGRNRPPSPARPPRRRARGRPVDPVQEVDGVGPQLLDGPVPHLPACGVDERVLRPVGVEDVEDAVGVPGQFAEVPGRPLALGPGDGVGDPVGQYPVLAGAGLLLEVVGRAGRDGVARDRLRALSGEEDERQDRGPLADGPEELDAGPSGRVVIRDDAVVLAVAEPGQSLVDARGDIDVEPLVLALEVGRGHLRDGWLVVGVEDANPLQRGAHRLPSQLTRPKGRFG